ncbi:hypothetical protein PIB30_094028, partial [Stylosanthes scabra]|nr:hypothetical protein [Stylosanthes scabra]
FGPEWTKPRNYENAINENDIEKGGKAPNPIHSSSSFTEERKKRIESWWRIDSRTGSNQLFHHSPQLPVAITFDTKLRLTHGLRLREALVILFKSI